MSRPKKSQKLNYANFFTVKNISEDVGEICIYADIADSPYDSWDEVVTLKDIDNQLKELGAVKQLDLRINCYGGDVFAGNAIFNILDTYKKKNNTHITGYVDGIARSMGSGILMVADEIVMYENSMQMVHKPISVVYGNADDLQRGIDLLNKTEECLITNYMRHFNGTEEQLKEIMAAETWLNAKEAYALGLCTQIAETDIEIAASAKGIKVGNMVFGETTLKSDFENKNIKITEESEVEIGNMADVEKNVDTAEKVEITDKVELTDKVEFTEFISKDATVKALGAEHTADEVLNFAKKGAVDYPTLENTIAGLKNEISTLTAAIEAKDKLVEKYNKVHKRAVDEALKNGVRAMGENFNTDVWAEYLDNADYDTVITFSNGWVKEAEMILNAGKRISEQTSALKTKNIDYSAKEYENI